MSACNILQAINQAAVARINRLEASNRSLEEMALLLERTSKFKAALPDVSKLVPIATISFDGPLSDYNMMRDACPFLNLPDPAVAKKLGYDQLIAQMTDAYRYLASMCDMHPSLRINRFKKMLARFNKHLNVNPGAILGYMRCADVVCEVADNMSSQVYSYQTTFAAGNSPVNLSDTFAEAIANAGGTKTKINSLL